MLLCAKILREAQSPPNPLRLCAKKISWKHNPPRTPLRLCAEIPQTPTAKILIEAQPRLLLASLTKTSLPNSAIGHTSTVPAKPPSYLSWSYKHSPPKTPLPISAIGHTSTVPPKPPGLSLQLFIQAQFPQNPLPISATGHTSTIPQNPLPKTRLPISAVSQAQSPQNLLAHLCNCQSLVASRTSHKLHRAPNFLTSFQASLSKK